MNKHQTCHQPLQIMQNVLPRSVPSPGRWRPCPRRRPWWRPPGPWGSSRCRRCAEGEVEFEFRAKFGPRNWGSYRVEVGGGKGGGVLACVSVEHRVVRRRGLWGHLVRNISILIRNEMKFEVLSRGLPYMTSTVQTKGTQSVNMWQWQGGGGQKIRKFCGHHIWKSPNRSGELKSTSNKPISLTHWHKSPQFLKHFIFSSWFTSSAEKEGNPEGVQIFLWGSVFFSSSKWPATMTNSGGGGANSCGGKTEILAF